MDTKYCKRCDQTLSVDKFTKAKKRYDGLQPYCSECMKAYRREHYHANKKPYLDRAREQKKQAKKEIRWFKQTNPCTDCGVVYDKEPWLMDFDHLDAEEKLYNISRIYCRGSKAIREELAKCELVCVLCHRRRSARRAGWEHLVDNPFND